MKGLSRARACLLGAAGAAFPLGGAGAALLLGGAGAAFLLGGAGAAFLLGGAGVSPAFGQVVGTGTWLWDVTTQDGDNIVHPGETATIRLSLDLSPSVGEPGQSGGTVIGFGAAIFDTLGGLNADKGTILGWEVHCPLDFLFPDVTTTDGVSLFGTTPAQVSGSQAFSNADPIGVLTFEWQPQFLGAYAVHYATRTNVDLFIVWESGDNDGVYWSRIVEAGVIFHVVPAPGATILLGTCVLGAVIRRSRR
jgi:hypothetical protein